MASSLNIDKHIFGRNLINGKMPNGNTLNDRNRPEMNSWQEVYRLDIKFFHYDNPLEKCVEN